MNPPKQLFVAFFMVNLAFPFLSNGQTYVSGNIIEDTEWTEEGSPYIITSSVTIDSGAVLTTVSGVVVRGFIDEDQETQPELLIKGSIRCSGTNFDRLKLNFQAEEDTFDDPAFLGINLTFDDVLMINAATVNAFLHGQVSILNSHLIDSRFITEDTELIVKNTLFEGEEHKEVALDLHYSCYGLDVERMTCDPSLVIENCTFENFKTAIVFDNDTNYGTIGIDFKIKHNSFVNIGDYFVRIKTEYGWGIFDFTQNYWSTTDTAVINSKISGRVDYSAPLIAPTTNIPLYAPKNLFRISQPNGTFIGWDTNEADHLAGYKIYRKQSGEYELLADVGNATSYLSDVIEDDDIIVITGYNANADGAQDIVEGNESYYSDNTKKFLLSESTKLMSSSVCRDSLIVQLYPGFEPGNDGVVLQLSDTTGSFEDALDLAVISNTSNTLSALLPDSIAYGVPYQVRVLFGEVISDTVEIVPSENVTSSFQTSYYRCPANGTSIVYTGNAPSDATFSWNFGDARYVLGSNGYRVFEFDGPGPYWAVYNDSLDYRKVTLQVSQKGCIATVYSDSIQMFPSLDFAVPTSAYLNKDYTVEYVQDNYPGLEISWSFPSSSTTSSKSGPGLHTIQFTNPEVTSGEIKLYVSSYECGTFLDTTITVNILVKAPLGLESSEKTLLVFPNPTNDYLNVSPEPGLKGIYILLNLAGQEMEYGVLTGPMKIDLRNKAKGTYLLQVQTDSGIFVRRVVKK